MAEFTQRQQEALPPAYVGASQGVRQEADTSAAILGRGLTAAFEQAVQGTDALIQEDIRADATAGFDAINDEFGIGAATIQEQGIPGQTPGVLPPPTAEAQADGTAPRPLPMGLEDAGNQLSSLEAGFRKGAIGEKHYWARLNSMTRQLYGKYPGYREQIDGIIGDVTGSRPANSLRAALMSEWTTETTGDKAKKAYDDLVERASFSGDLPSDFFQRQEAGNPYSQAELLKSVSDKTALKSETEARRAANGLDIELGQMDRVKVVEAWNGESSTVVVSALQDATKGAGLTYAKINEGLERVRTDYASGKPMTAETAEAMRLQMGTLRSQIQNLLTLKTTEAWDGTDGKKSYAEVLTKAEIDDAVTKAMMPLQILEDALSNEDYGVLGLTASYLESQSDQITRQLSKDIPALQTLQAMQKLYGADATKLYLSLIPGVQEAIMDQFLKYDELKKHVDPANPGSATEDFTAIQNNPNLDDGQKAAYFEGRVESWKKLAAAAASGELPPQMIQTEVQHLFGPKNFELLAAMDGATRIEYFKSMTSGDITREMLKLQAAGDTQSYSLYKQWTLNAFQGVYTSSLQELNRFNLDRRERQIVFNPQSNRFEFVKATPGNGRNAQGQTTNDPLFGIDLGRGAGAVVRGLIDYNEADKYLADLNSAVANIVPILQADGQPVGPQLFNIFNRLKMEFSPDSIAGSVQESLTVPELRSRQEESSAAMDRQMQERWWQENLPFEAPFLAPEETDTKQGVDPYSLIPATGANGEDQHSMFQQWNPDPVGNHDSLVASVDPKLQQVITRAQEISGQKFVAGSGFRTGEQQQMAQDFGWSKTGESNHEHGGALDLWPVDDQGRVFFDPKAQDSIGASMQQAATELGINVKWGKDFNDLPHFELAEDPTEGWTASAVNSKGPNSGSRGQVAIMDLLGRTEATDRGAGYNETLAYGAYTDGPVNLVGMTLGEVDALQTDMLNHPDNDLNSSAVGRYQIVRTTMRKLATEMGLSPDTKFTPEIQDQMAVKLLKSRGLDAWRRGEMPDADFLDELSKEWASLPTSRGTGHYRGQRAAATPAQVLAALKKNPYPEIAIHAGKEVDDVQMPKTLISFASLDIDNKMSVLERLIGRT